MPEELNHTGVRVAPKNVAGEPAERWDVGLGERLAETIWKWLGREAVTMQEAQRDPEPVRLRKAA